MKALLLLVAVCLFADASCQEAGFPAVIPTKEQIAKCQYAPGLSVGNRSEVESCCNITERNFLFSWGVGNYFLSTYLQTLQSWNCSQLEAECRRRYFVVNQYSSLMYDYFCDYTSFVHKCFASVNDTYKGPLSERRNNQSVITQWRDLVTDLNSSYFTLEELIVPCVQVAVYDAETEHRGDYLEVSRFYLPSCEPVLCGFGGESIRNRFISAWTCMPNSCRAKLISMMVICGLLAVIITFANLSVILVYSFNPAMMNSQGVYKTSLAVADLLIGLVIFPTFISTLTIFSFTRYSHGSIENVTGYETINGTISNDLTTVEMKRVNADTYILYLNFVGFFTVVSLTCSIYILTVAGLDRLKVVYKPLSYNKADALRFAKIQSLVIYGIAILFAILPIFVPTLNYGFVASVLVSSYGPSALIIYCVAFAIPLIGMWVVNILTFIATLKHARVRQKLTAAAAKKNTTSSIEVRLAKTLLMMVGGFTLSILPTIILVLASLFVKTISFNNPSNLDIGSAVLYSALQFTAVVVLACNSLWNFFIYSARNEDFRVGLKVVYNKLGFARCQSKVSQLSKRGKRDHSTTSDGFTSSSGFSARSGKSTSSTWMTSLKRNSNSKINSSVQRTPRNNHLSMAVEEPSTVQN